MTTLLWLLLLAPLLAGWLVQRRLVATFARSADGKPIGWTGAELARALLDAHGLRRVRLEVVSGFLSDHHDGAAHALRLSRLVALERSVSESLATRYPTPCRTPRAAAFTACVRSSPSRSPSSPRGPGSPSSAAFGSASRS
jgi:hypothetical protein